jgi:hypothetical protein
VNSLTLWQLTDQYLQAMQLLADNDDLPPEVVRDTLDALAGDLTTKAQNVAAYTKMLDNETEAIKAEIDRLRGLEKRVDKHAQRLREYLLENMKRAEISKIESTQAPFFKISIRKNPPRVVLDDENMIPWAYKRQKITEEIARDDIKRDLAQGIDVPGAHLEQIERVEIK